MQNKRFLTLQKQAEEIEQAAFDLEVSNHTEEEIPFFAVHGYWLEDADVDERTESSFTTRGLKTTIILERASLGEEAFNTERSQTPLLLTSAESEIETCLPFRKTDR